jgi:hypothetical protein
MVQFSGGIGNVTTNTGLCFVCAFVLGGFSDRQVVGEPVRVLDVAPYVSLSYTYRLRPRQRH